MTNRLTLLVILLIATYLGAWADGTICYKSRSWDTTKNLVVTVDCEREPSHYVTISGENNEWQQLGPSQYYAVTENAGRKTLVVKGEAHLILCDNTTLTLTGGLKLEDEATLHIYSQSDGDSKGRLVVTNSYGSTAGIGGARSTKMGTLYIHGGDINVTGGDYGAGIGGGEDSDNGPVTIYGGKVKAQGGKYGAGIGGGYAGNQGNEIKIYGGDIIANGGIKAAGIGGGRNWRGGGNGGRVIIHHATVNAEGGKYGAGIGGGCGNGDYGHGGHVSIYSGDVTAKGGEDAAGIGGGEDGNGGTLNIEGGTVTIVGTGKGAGIGGGKNGSGGYFDINSERFWTSKTKSEVTVTAGNNCSHAIGGGNGGSNSVDIRYGLQVHVFYGSSLASQGETPAVKGLRETRSNDQVSLKLTPCDHSSETSHYDFFPHETYHEKVCKYCKYNINEDHEATNCPCGTNMPVKCTVYVYHSELNIDTGEPKYVLLEKKTITAGKTYTMPEHAKIKDNLEFAGWLIAPPSEPETVFKADDEELPSHGYTYTVPSQSEVSIFARYNYHYDAIEWNWAEDYSEATALLYCQAAPEGQQCIEKQTTSITTESQEPTLEEEGSTIYHAQLTSNGNIYTDFKYEPKYYSIELKDNEDNATVLAEANGNMVNVTIGKRTFYHDGSWNTLCLPFDVARWDLTETGCPLNGATIKELDAENTTFDSSTGTLRLRFKNAYSEEKEIVMEAGKPYLVRWSTGDNRPAPVFNAALVKTTSPVIVSSTDGSVSFVPTFAPVLMPKNDQNTLYMGANNKLYYPTRDNTYINAFRAYFAVTNASSARAITAVDIDFDDNLPTRIYEIQGETDMPIGHNAWYTLNGQAIDGKPTAKGIYIYNNRKIVQQ